MKLIEKTFPVREVNALAAHEMAFLKLLPGWGRRSQGVLGISKDVKKSNLPKLHNLHYYPAREPLAVARVLNAAAALPEDASAEELLRIAGVEELKRRIEAEGRLYGLFSVEPDREALRRRLGGRTPLVVDPMAGGGTIPLEAKRLGLRVVAGDLNPVAYLLLRASIEFPAKYGRQLFQLVLEEAKKLLQYAQQELSRYYPSDAKAVIYVKGAAHTCGGAVPIVKVTTLSREKGLYYGFEFKDGKVRAKLQDKPYAPPAVCPHCGKPLSVKELQRKWAEEHKKLIGDLLAGKTEGIEERIRQLYIPAAVVQDKRRLPRTGRRRPQISRRGRQGAGPRKRCRICTAHRPDRQRQRSVQTGSRCRPDPLAPPLQPPPTLYSLQTPQVCKRKSQRTEGKLRRTGSGCRAVPSHRNKQSDYLQQRSYTMGLGYRSQ
jgi:hypothetical protein